MAAKIRIANDVGRAANDFGVGRFQVDTGGTREWRLPRELAGRFVFITVETAGVTVAISAAVTPSNASTANKTLSLTPTAATAGAFSSQAGALCYGQQVRPFKLPEWDGKGDAQYGWLVAVSSANTFLWVETAS